MSVRSTQSSSKSTKVIDWLIYRVGGLRAAYVGRIKAPNRATALALAYDEFEVELADRKRLIAIRASDHA